MPDRPEPESAESLADAVPPDATAPTPGSWDTGSTLLLLLFVVIAALVTAQNVWLRRKARDERDEP